MNIIIDVAGNLTSTGHSPVSTPDRLPLPNVMMAGDETLGKKCRCWLFFLKTMIVDEHHNRCGW